MVECPKCGNEVGDNKFCGNCGERIAEVCPECGGELGDEDNFCPNCGVKLDEDSAEESIVDESVDEDSAEESSEESSEEDSVDDSADGDESVDEDSADDSEDESPDEDESKKEDGEAKPCPHCGTELSDDEDFCPECGRPTNIEFQSFDGIKHAIELKKVIVFSLISILFAAVLSFLFSILFSMIAPAVDLYPIGFFISIIIVVLIFASFRDFVNGGLVGIITGLVLGLLAPFIVELSSGFSFGYVMFSGYQAIIFTVVGAVAGVVSSRYLRKSVAPRIDVEELF